MQGTGISEDAVGRLVDRGLIDRGQGRLHAVAILGAVMSSDRLSPQSAGNHCSFCS